MNFDCDVQGALTAASIFGGAATQLQGNLDTAVANLCVSNAWNVNSAFCVFGQGGGTANITDYCLAHNVAGQVLLNSATTINVHIASRKQQLGPSERRTSQGHPGAHRKRQVASGRPIF